MREKTEDVGDPSAVTIVFTSDDACRESVLMQPITHIDTCFPTLVSAPEDKTGSAASDLPLSMKDWRFFY